MILLGGEAILGLCDARLLRFATNANPKRRERASPKWSKPLIADVGDLQGVRQLFTMAPNLLLVGV